MSPNYLVSNQLEAKIKGKSGGARLKIMANSQQQGDCHGRLSGEHRERLPAAKRAGMVAP